MNVLRISLLSNGAFSFTTGSLIVIFQKWMSDVFGLSQEWLWWIIGLSLILFSLSVLDQARKLEKVKIQIIITLDLLWVISSVVFLLIHPSIISSTGYGLISAVAALVFCLGIGQWYGIRMIRSSGLV